MKLKQPSFTMLGIAGSVIFFAVFILILISSLYTLMFPDLTLVYTANTEGLLWMTGATLLIISSGLYYVQRALYSNPDFFLSYKDKWLPSLTAFISLTAASAAFIYVLNDDSFTRPVRMYICIAVLFFAAFPFFYLLHFFVYLFLIRLFRDTLNLSDIITHRSNSINDLHHFLSIHSSILNRCKRSGGLIAVIGIMITDTSELEKEYGSNGIKQIMRQLDFVLAEHSRNYEPWGVLNEKLLFFNFFLVLDTEELDQISSRFSEIISTSDFAVTDKAVRISHSSRILTVRPEELPTTVFESEEIEFLRNMIADLTDQFKLEKETDINGSYTG